MRQFDDRRDPTRPIPPAFTKLTARVDLMERQAKRKAKGGLVESPMLLARMDKRGKRDAGSR